MDTWCKNRCSCLDVASHYGPPVLCSCFLFQDITLFSFSPPILLKNNVYSLIILLSSSHKRLPILELYMDYYKTRSIKYMRCLLNSLNMKCWIITIVVVFIFYFFIFWFFLFVPLWCLYFWSMRTYTHFLCMCNIICCCRIKSTWLMSSTLWNILRYVRNS